MNTSDDIGLFSLLPLANYVIASGVRRVHESPSISHGEYEAHWTGSEWEASEKQNAFVWRYKKYAEEYLDENRELLIEKLRDYNRS